jgi:hypothetical protein
VTADELLQNVKDRAALPPGQVVLTDAKILSDANEEMLALVGPVLESTSEEYFTVSLDYPIAAGQAAYAVPADAMGGGLRKVVFVDVNGVEADAALNRVELADIGRYTALASNEPLGFWYSASWINLLPTPQAASGSIRVYYSVRLPSLGNTAATDYLTGTPYGGANPTWLATQIYVTTTFGAPFAVGAVVDFYSAQDEAKLLAYGTLTSIGTAGPTYYLASSGSFTRAADLLAAQALGYTIYASVRGQKAYIPRLPREWHSLLELRTAARAMLKLGNLKEAQACMQTANEMKGSLLALAQPRAAQNPRKISAWRR